MITGGGNYTTWQLNPVVPAGLPAPGTGSPASPVTAQSFLGYGITTPFVRGPANDFAAAGGPELVKSRMRAILGTRRSTRRRPGEVAWRGEFGSRLHLLRHKNDTDVLAGMAQQYVIEALSRWEPCVSVAFCQVLKTGNLRALTLRVVYDIVTTSPAGNMVVQQDELELPLTLAGTGT